MKILYHHRVASKDGQYVHIEEIISSLRKLGHEVIVCEPASIEKTQFGKGSGTVDSLRAYLPGFVGELAELCYGVVDYLKMRRLIRTHKPDCIYERYNLYFLSGVWAKRRYSLPYIVEVNAPLFLERQKNGQIALPALARWTEDKVWLSGDRVLPVTRVLGDIITERGVEKERVKVIPNGINATFCDGLPGPEEINGRYQLDGKLVLGFTGFVREWHGLDRVLTVIAQNPQQPWHLLLVGDGPDRERLELIAADLGISDRLSITGVIDRKAMPEYIQRFDIALQPDVVEYASPLKMFEYLAMGRPIIAPDTANIREILTNGENAFLFDPLDDSFAEKLQQMCTDDALRARLGEAAAMTIEDKKLFWDTNAIRIVQFFDELLAQ